MRPATTGPSGDLLGVRVGASCAAHRFSALECYGVLSKSRIDQGITRGHRQRVVPAAAFRVAVLAAFRAAFFTAFLPAAFTDFFFRFAIATSPGRGRLVR